ncbi:MAG: hypothetical protein LBU32_22570 [Clostridiales bacterium]|jgi:hypothetical protein|nr:hypothetical protein [Clostridiales bacterium]
MAPFDRVLEEVLNRSKYNFLTGRYFDLRQWLLKIIMRFLNWLLGLFSINLDENFQGSGVLATVFVVVFALALAALIGLIAFFSIRRLRRKAGISDVFEGIAKDATPDELLEASRSLLYSGKIREAARRCFAAVLRALDEGGVIDISPAKTNNQLKNEVRSKAPRFFDAFGMAADMFTSAWFGNKAINTEKFANALNKAAIMVREVESHK